MTLSQAKIDLVNRESGRFTLVQDLRYTCDLNTGECSVILVLAENEETEGEANLLTIVFHRVSGLRLDDFGGGINQILGLRAIDVSADQIEGRLFEFIDLEHARLELFCRDFDVFIPGLT